MSNDLNDLNEILFNQINKISKTPVTDKDFKAKKDKANAIVNIAEKILKTQELILRNDVWASTYRNRYIANQSVLRITNRDAENY